MENKINNQAEAEKIEIEEILERYENMKDCGSHLGAIIAREDYDKKIEAWKIKYPQAVIKNKIEVLEREIEKHDFSSDYFIQKSVEKNKAELAELKLQLK